MVKNRAFGDNKSRGDRLEFFEVDKKITDYECKRSAWSERTIFNYSCYHLGVISTFYLGKSWIFSNLNILKI